MSKGNIITDESVITHFTQTPNIIDDMDLSPYAVRLYLRFKRRVNQESDGTTSGECYETTKNLARSCNMSSGQVSNSKKELKESGVIRIEKVKGLHGEWDNDHITIVNIWKANGFYFSDRFSVTIPSLEKTFSGKEAREVIRKNPELRKLLVDLINTRSLYERCDSFSESERS